MTITRELKERFEDAAEPKTLKNVFELLDEADELVGDFMLENNLESYDTAVYNYVEGLAETFENTGMVGCVNAEYYFYAVQVGEETDCSTGSFEYDEAMEIAEGYAQTTNEEVRIVVCTSDDDFAIKTITVQEAE